MKDLLNAGQVLGRSEMKKIMAGTHPVDGPCWFTCKRSDYPEPTGSCDAAVLCPGPSSNLTCSCK